MDEFIELCRQKLSGKRTPLTNQEIQELEFLYTLLGEYLDFTYYSSIGGRRHRAIAIGPQKGKPIFGIFSIGSEVDHRLQFGFKSDTIQFREDLSNAGFSRESSIYLSNVYNEPDTLYEFLKATLVIPFIKGAFALSEKSLEEIYAQVKVRGYAQIRFKNALFQAFNYQCAVTGCTINPLLEGAHINSVKDGGEGLYTPHNGLLLRRDIHTLMDAGLLSFIQMGNKVSVKINKAIREDKNYGKYHKKTLKLPKENREKWIVNLRRSGLLLPGTDKNKR